MSIYDKSSLVLIPSGTKTSKVYSQKPVNGDGDFTFSRSTAATRVNADGNIEKETQNLLLQSNSFDTNWYNTSTTETGGQSGYDGSSDAWLLSKTGTSGRIVQTISNTGVQTFSVYAKAGSLNWMRLITIRTAGNSPRADFDLSGSGAVGVTSNTIDATIESIGGGWFRCSLVANVALTEARIYPADANNDVSGTSGNILIQDAQVEQGLVARDYIETTTAAVEGGITDNVPRLDYTDSSCPALLLEPQRTNAYLNSEYFGSWNSNRADLTANAVTSPEGVTNSYKVAQQSGFTISPNVNITGLTANTYTASIFAKKGTWDYIAVSFNGVSYFNLDSGTKGTTHPNHTSSIEDYGNGWYRCTITITTTSTQTIAYYIAESNSTLSTPDTQGYAYIYGAQIESASSYATSYIPTYGTSVTRNGDTNTITNALTSISGVNGLSLFFEVDAAVISGAVRYSLLQTISGSAEWVFLSYESSSSIRGYIRSNSSTSWDFSWNGIPTTGTIKVLLTMTNGGDGKLYGNGQLRVSNGGVVLSQTLDSVALGGTTGVAESQQYLKQFMVFPTALSNEEAIALTTI